ncbi:MAG TPA: TonB family protein [Sphingomicrobium sp.]|nr:TonB family protein [Sphingomicrobium sp.]
MNRSQQIEERAAQWLLQREEPSWSAADQVRLDEWLSQSDAHKVAFWRLEYGWRKADRLAALAAPSQPAARWDDLSWRRPLALAASLVLVFSFLVGHWSSAPQPTQSPLRFETAVGGHKLISLPDGSRVELNTDTQLRAVVNATTRAVWLERGEAFFDIAKQPNRNFVIYAGTRTITVLGTKFSVRRKQSDLVVAVLEGRVRVDAAEANVAARHATVGAGDVAIASGRSTLVTKSPEVVQEQLAWRTGRLLLHDVTLADAAAEFNRYNQKKLVIDDPQIASLSVGGSFLARNVEAFAQLLRDVYGVDTRHRTNTITLAGRRVVDRAAPDAPKPVAASLRATNIPRGSQCGAGAADCAVVSLAPATEEADSRAAQERVLRNERNWDVLHKLYPARALAAREEGLVGFTVKIDARGNPTACKITHSSGHPLLDLETCQLIMVHATFKTASTVTVSQQRSYEGVVNWRLPGSAREAAPPAPQRVAEAPPPEELICKRFPQTGSNAAFERRCMTKSEWQRSTARTREAWDDAQGTRNTCQSLTRCD